MIETRSQLITSPQALSRHGIGGSDIAAVLGLSPYRAPIQVWREKVGLDEPFAGNEQTMWGQALEPIVRAQYSVRNRVLLFVPPTSLFHKDHDWCRATPDGIVLDDNDGWRWLVQVKTVGPRSIKRWDGDKLPTEYEAQVQWEMFVTGLDRADFAVLLGGQEYQERVVLRNQAVIDDMYEMAAQWWHDYVVGHREPPPDSSVAYQRHLEERMRLTDSEVVLAADRETDLLVKQLREVKQQIAELEEREQELRNHVTKAMADAHASHLHTSEGPITWKATKDREVVDWKATAEDMANELALVAKDSKAAMLWAGRSPASIAETVASRHTKQAKPQRRFVVPRSWGGAF